MDYVGVPLAVVVFLLPGFAWLLLSGLLKRVDVFCAVAVSFIFSVCALSVTSALLSLLTSKYLLYTIVLALTLPSLVVMIVCIREGAFRKFLGESAHVSPALLLCLIAYVLFLMAYCWSMPYYPRIPAFDPLNNAQVVQGIFSGSGRSILLHANAAVGLHFVAAILMFLLAVNPLQSLRIVASFVLLTILVLIFMSAQALFDDRNLASLTTIVGGLVLPADAMHFTLIGTYPNLVDDAIILVTVFVLFSYIKKPSVPFGMTLAFLGLAGVFTHSSFLIFLAALWVLLPVLFVIFRGGKEFPRYLRGVTYSTVGVFVAASVALSFLRGSVERVLQAYSITSYIGGATTSQLLQSILVIYQTLAWNIIFLIKPLNVVAIILGFFLVAMRRRQSVGSVFAAAWLGVLAILSLLSGETDRFVLFSMMPSIFLVGNLIGKMPLPKVRSVMNRRLITSGILLVLVAFGGFLPLIPIAFSPTTRLHEQNVFASMEWLEQNPCPSTVASLGLDLDFRYLSILTNAQYAGSLSSTSSPAQVLQDSRATGFACVAIETNNPNFHSFELNQAFQEKYRNDEVAIFFIVS